MSQSSKSGSAEPNRQNLESSKLFDTLVLLDSSVDKDDYYDTKTNTWDIDALKSDIILSRKSSQNDDDSKKRSISPVEQENIQKNVPKSVPTVDAKSNSVSNSVQPSEKSVKTGLSSEKSRSVVDASRKPSQNGRSVDVMPNLSSQNDPAVGGAVTHPKVKSTNKIIPSGTSSPRDSTASSAEHIPSTTPINIASKVTTTTSVTAATVNSAPTLSSSGSSGPRVVNPPASQQQQIQQQQVPGLQGPVSSPSSQYELQARIIQTQQLRVQQQAAFAQQQRLHQVAVQQAQAQAQVQAQRAAHAQAQQISAQARAAQVQRAQQQAYANQQRRLHQLPNPSGHHSRRNPYEDQQESDGEYSVDASDGDEHSVYEPSNDELTDDEGGMPRDDEDADLMSDAENLAEELREPVKMPEPVLPVVTSDNEYASDFEGEDSGNEEYHYSSEQDEEDDEEFDKDEQIENSQQPFKRSRIQ